MNEPEWIEHDGSAVCPVPAGHDVETRFRDGDVERGSDPETWIWHNLANHPDYDITHYRDWTAWEQSKMSKTDDVAGFDWSHRRVYELARDGMPDGVFVSEAMIVAAFARYIAAHEPAPVDPLRAVIDEAWPTIQLRGVRPEIVFEELRARSVTLETGRGEG